VSQVTTRAVAVCDDDSVNALAVLLALVNGTKPEACEPPAANARLVLLTTLLRHAKSAFVWNVPTPGLAQ